MKIPLSWLREYVDFGSNVAAVDVLAALVRVGLEEESVYCALSEISGPIVVGQVLDMVPEKQKNGKTINWCQVDVGESGLVGIVCGAHNFVVGDKVVVALPGAVLPGDFRIAARKTYGHVSAGMIASAAELGISDDSEGIIVLADLGLDAPVGLDALGLLGLDDEVAEINVTPDRGYCLSLRGVAREYSHATGVAFCDPVLAVGEVLAEGAGFPVVLSDQAPIRGRVGVNRFVAQTVRNVDASRVTPYWMVSRLRLAGIRSVSIVVDITNYVMLELGQPLHAYDLQKISGSLVVRRAQLGEVLTTLDGKVRELVGEDLVVADDVKVLGLAGVMGGVVGEVSVDTCEVLVEAAHFDAVSVARCARRHKLFSEAAKRFERGVDANLALVAVARVVELLVELAGGVVFGGVTDVGEGIVGEEIFLPEGYVSKRVGYDYSGEQVVGSLRNIGAEVVEVVGGFVVVPPSWRPDLVGVAELSEEVARLVGYDLIPKRLPQVPVGFGLSDGQRRLRFVLRLLADFGLVEVFSYPFVDEVSNDLFGAAVSGSVRAVELANPISFEKRFLRTSVLPGMFEVLQRNISRGNKDVAIYETGLVFLPDEKVALGSVDLPGVLSKPEVAVLEGLDLGVPLQPLRLGVLLCGLAGGVSPGVGLREFDWADGLDVVYAVARVLGVEVVVSQGVHQAWHPGRTAVVRLKDGSLVGFVGQLHPRVVKSFRLPVGVVALELDLGVLFEAVSERVVAASFSSFPVATQDVALEVGCEVAAGDVLEVLREGAGVLLEDVVLFDVYVGDGVAVGRKSLGFTLRFRAADRTLTADEVTGFREAAVALVCERFGAVQR